MTQNERILRHLEEIGTIDPMTALRDYSIMRLAARISDLRSQGYNISCRMVNGKNRFGEKVSYAEYSLVKEVRECP